MPTGPEGCRRSAGSALGVDLRDNAAVNRNIEIKAKCDCLDRAEALARELAGDCAGVEQQCDTYFRTSSGRLKLRHRLILEPSDAALAEQWELIWYDRPNTAQAKASNYKLIRVIDGADLRQLLIRGLGLAVEIRKRRAVYLHDEVRIHLDEVEELGAFIEFEALVTESCDDASARAKLERLNEAFQIRPEQLVEVSYSDLLLSANSSSMSDSNLARR